MDSLTPHGYCLHWEHTLLWTMVSSDAVIALSYFSIPIAIWFFAKRRNDVGNNWLFHLFALFIIACGFTHVMSMVTIWYPNYWLSAIAKGFTAIFSIITAIVLWVYMPNFLSAPSVFQLRKAQLELTKMNTTLEQRVNERTEELHQAYASLRESLELEKKYQRAKAEINHLITYDLMTGLVNKDAFLKLIEKIQSESKITKKFSFILCSNIDNLKRINDAKGYDFGDKVIMAFSKMMKKLINEQGELCRAEGGDSFIYVSTQFFETREEAVVAALSLLDSINKALSIPIDIDTEKFKISHTAGINIFDGQEFSPSDLIRGAVIAMRQGKEDKENKLHIFDENIQTKLVTRIDTELALQHAIPEELQLFFQPQVDSKGRLIGAEALIRWHRPQYGYISPAEFIPLAEESGLILQIGSWVLEEGFKQLQRWSKSPSHQHLRLAINISTKQILSSGFVTEVRTLLEKYKVDPQLLELELTETALLTNLEVTGDRMRSLRALGLRFALDDFGTGFSSLTYLKLLPIDKLKIDQSFIFEMLENTNDAAIVRGVIALGTSLGLEVIAEGVETEEHKQFLEIHGCSMYQGYYFAKPMPIEDFVKLGSNLPELSVQPNLL